MKFERSPRRHTANFVWPAGHTLQPGNSHVLCGITLLSGCLLNNRLAILATGVKLLRATVRIRIRRGG